jgi:hypothetical protein
MCSACNGTRYFLIVHSVRSLRNTSELSGDERDRSLTIAVLGLTPDHGRTTSGRYRRVPEGEAFSFSNFRTSSSKALMSTTPT